MPTSRCRRSAIIVKRLHKLEVASTTDRSAQTNAPGGVGLSVIEPTIVQTRLAVSQIGTNLKPWQFRCRQDRCPAKRQLQLDDGISVGGAKFRAGNERRAASPQRYERVCGWNRQYLVAPSVRNTERLRMSRLELRCCREVVFGSIKWFGACCRCIANERRCCGHKCGCAEHFEFRNELANDKDDESFCA